MPDLSVPFAIFGHPTRVDENARVIDEGHPPSRYTKLADGLLVTLWWVLLRHIFEDVVLAHWPVVVSDERKGLPKTVDSTFPSCV